MKQKGKVVSKQEFLSDGTYAKEQYEGLLVASDLKQGCYKLGVQVDENKILMVDQATEDNIREKVLNWSAQIEDIQRRYNAQADLQNYD